MNCAEANRGKCRQNPGVPSRVSFRGFPPKEWSTSTSGSMTHMLFAHCMQKHLWCTCHACLVSTHACRASTLHTALSSHVITPSAKPTIASSLPARTRSSQVHVSRDPCVNANSVSDLHRYRTAVERVLPREYNAVGIPAIVMKSCCVAFT